MLSRAAIISRHLRVGALNSVCAAVPLRLFSDDAAYKLVSFGETLVEGLLYGFPWSVALVAAATYFVLPRLTPYFKLFNTPLSTWRFPSATTPMLALPSARAART